MNKYAWVYLALLGLVISVPASSNETYMDNPQPDAGDYILPMPGGLEMVFRAIPVPGRSFWGDANRLVQMGDETGGNLFETPSKIEIGGSFRSPDGNDWLIYLGKYEVTRGQIAAVMGGGDINAGLEWLFKHSSEFDLAPATDAENIEKIKQEIRNASGLKRWRMLAFPVSGLHFQDYMEFILGYNEWCFQSPQCLAALPKFEACASDDRACQREMQEPKAVPGFLRLPTEAEWEYSVRGNPTERSQFEKELPFDRIKLKEYAWVNDNALRRIGRKQPIHGLYDMFGNVNELTWGLFHTRIGGGKPGALAARGGASLDAHRDFRSSMRTEVGLYQWNDDSHKMVPTRSPFSGIRLSIGSYTILHGSFKNRLAENHKKYLEWVAGVFPGPGTGTTSTTVVGTSASPGRAYLVGEALNEIRVIAGELQSTDPILADRLQTHADSAQANLVKEIQAKARKSAKNALAFSYEFGRKFHTVKMEESVLGKARNLADTNVRIQAQIHKLRERFERERAQADDNFDDYIGEIIELGDIPGEIIRETIQLVGKDIPLSDRLGQAAYQLLDKHVTTMMSGRVARDTWLQDLEGKYQDDSLFVNR